MDSAPVVVGREPHHRGRLFLLSLDVVSSFGKYGRELLERTELPRTDGTGPDDCLRRHDQSRPGQGDTRRRLPVRDRDRPEILRLRTGFDRLSHRQHRISGKTLVDCSDHPEHCGGILELAKALGNAEDLDLELLVDYLLQLGNGAAVKRIGYLADVLDIELPRRTELEDAFTKGYSKLDPGQGDDGTHSSEYRLLLNVSNEAIENTGGDFY